MNTIWRSLIWREWHEHKWKLAALTVIMLSVQIAVILEDHNLDIPVVMIWVLCGGPGAFFIGLHAASGERSGRTLAFVRGLPVSIRRAAIAKLALGAMTSVAPVLAAVLLTIGWAVIWPASGGRIALGRAAMFTDQAGLLADLLLIGLAAAAFSLSLFLWTALAAMNQSTELRAAAVGSAALVGWLLVIVVIAFLGRLGGPSSSLVWKYAMAATPIGALSSTGLVIPVWRIVTLQLGSLLAVAWWAVMRFGRMGPADDHSPGGARPDELSRPLAAPRSRPWRAMAWKQWREATPLSLAGVGLIFGMTGLFALLGWMASSELDWTPSKELPRFLNGATLVVGTLVALIVGATSFAADLQPGLWTFWRSRPIQPALWFWPKYLAGAAAVLAFLDLPLAALYFIAAAGNWQIEFPQGILACAPLLHLLAYSFAVCAICWVRRAIYAAILAFAFLAGVLGAPVVWPSLECLNVDRVIAAMNATPIVDFADLTATYLPFASVSLVLSAVTMLLAWSGAKHEHGLSDWTPDARLARRFLANGA
ncbi:MAG TPA: hypothetical protein VHC19_25150 [Pirellulales bacterium]|nr:hypothetical protein [Pirellulales bacterium]